jgi:hypothetical protein
MDEEGATERDMKKVTYGGERASSSMPLRGDTWAHGTYLSAIVKKNTWGKALVHTTR